MSEIDLIDGEKGVSSDLAERIRNSLKAEGFFTSAINLLQNQKPSVITILLEGDDHFIGNIQPNPEDTYKTPLAILLNKQVEEGSIGYTVVSGMVVRDGDELKLFLIDKDED